MQLRVDYSTQPLMVRYKLHFLVDVRGLYKPRFLASNIYESGVQESN
jgi:hypothetical protein